MDVVQTEKISSSFLWRRIHSLMGLWLVVYLLEHLLVNSQAALWIGDDGAGFVRLVNSLESLPFLQVIEWLLIGVPLLIHGIWGVKRALQARLNSFGGEGKAPRLPFARNRAFTWQRLSSWILLFGIVAHVVQMRILGYPEKVERENELRYLNVVSLDKGLYTLAPRLGVSLYTEQEIQALSVKQRLVNQPTESEEFAQNQIVRQEQAWVAALKKFRLGENEVVVEAKTPGAAMLLMVRDHFKSPWMALLYTLFVLAAAFHAFNGVWTAMITWGLTLSYRSQKAMRPISAVGVFLLSFLGLAAIWGSYWINLYN